MAKETDNKEQENKAQDNKKDVERAVEKMLKKAYAELGYKERGDGYTKFGNWFGKSYARLDWCAMFVCWVCYQGFGDKYTKYIVKVATADLPKQIVDAKKGSWVKAPGGKVATTPQPGDIWAVGSGKWFNHTGMVYSVDTKNKQIITIEGNCSDKVSSIRRSYDSLKCIARPKWGKVGNISAEGSEELDLTASIAQLYSSANYEYLEKRQEDPTVAKLNNIQDTISKNLRSMDASSFDTGAISETAKSVIDGAMEAMHETPIKHRKVEAVNLLSYPSFVEAPTISVSFNGVTIGGYGNVGDKYPNYLDSLTVTKINGKINQYDITLKYQVRAGEDPNFIDKLLSNTGYQNQVKILYGDSAMSSSLFREENAIITDCKYKESVASSTITYNIKALSASTMLSNKYATYATITDKPSNILHKLLYESGTTSKALQEYFPGMVSKTLVDAQNLIPTNDATVTVGGMEDVDVLTYMKHVIACMTNEADNTLSSYYLSFMDDVDNKMGGAYFKITELAQGVPELSNDNKAMYELDIGYPGNNFITNFDIVTDQYWPLVYEYNGRIPRYTYEIDNLGNLVENVNSSLLYDPRYQVNDIGRSNWWKDVTEFPIQAKVTLKGVTKPVMLMSYVKINCLFYGAKDLASGLYVVTNQEDRVSSNGCTTTLTLLRLSEDA